MRFPPPPWWWIIGFLKKKYKFATVTHSTRSVAVRRLVAFNAQCVDAHRATSSPVARQAWCVYTAIAVDVIKSTPPPPCQQPTPSSIETTSSTLCVCVWMLYRIAQWPAPTPLLVSQLLTLRDRTGSQLSALWCCYILLLFEKKRKEKKTIFCFFFFLFFGAVILFHANKQQHRVVKVYRVSECVSVCASNIWMR